ncbi:MAG: hypothetical protein IT305_07765 [Chloroflexi bacterium]|nr:hypothetical protein [Chloroflexota bacterium]
MPVEPVAKRAPNDSMAHQAFLRWRKAGVFAHLIERCEDLGGVDWEW